MPNPLPHCFQVFFGLLGGWWHSTTSPSRSPKYLTLQFLSSPSTSSAQWCQILLNTLLPCLLWPSWGWWSGTSPSPPPADLTSAPPSYSVQASASLTHCFHVLPAWWVVARHSTSPPQQVFLIPHHSPQALQPFVSLLASVFSSFNPHLLDT